MISTCLLAMLCQVLILDEKLILILFSTHSVGNDVDSAGTSKKQGESLTKRGKAVQLYEDTDKVMSCPCMEGKKPHNPPCLYSSGCVYSFC